MTELALISVFALMSGGQPAKAAPRQSGPGHSVGSSPDVEPQVSYVREQLAASGFSQVPGEGGAYRFEGNTPRLTIVLLEPKQPGAAPGSLAVMAGHPEGVGSPRIRQSILKFDSPRELAAHVHAVRAGFAETQRPLATASPKCPFARLLNSLSPSRSHTVLAVRQAQPLPLGSAHKATRSLEATLQWGPW